MLSVGKKYSLLNFILTISLKYDLFSGEIGFGRHYTNIFPCTLSNFSSQLMQFLYLQEVTDSALLFSVGIFCEQSSVAPLLDTTGFVVDVEVFFNTESENSSLKNG